MGSSTPNLNLYKPASSETGWASTVNANWDTLDERLFDLGVNVKDFGAAGDGVTDDWQALTDAITYTDANGSSLFWPSGIYKTTKTLDLSNLNAQHWVGGHRYGPSEPLLQFAMPPQVVIDGRTIGAGEGAAVHIDGGPSAAGGSHTFENITFLGNEQGFSADQAARVRFHNCAFKSYAMSGTDVCGLFMSRCFWFRFEGCTFHSADAAFPGVLFRAEAGINAQNCGLMSFHWCVWATGTNQFDINVVPPEDVGNIQFYECFAENNSAPFITFTENIPGNSTAYGIIGMRFQNVATEGTGPYPIVELDAANAHMDHPIFDFVDNEGSVAVKITDGSVRGAQLKRAGGITDAAGTGLDGSVVGANYSGLYLLGPTDTTAAESASTSNNGPPLKIAKTGDTYASFGVDGPGVLLWGPGGATATGWDTNLYRLSANILKTDDKLIGHAGLGAGNAVAGPFTTLGTIVAKVEIFNATGGSMGFLPIYGTIT